uniref:Uncharacterized protein n=1 Tax=Glossina austeni TaxID=7395 RepID=A0A1A9VJR0_GLOAU
MQPGGQLTITTDVENYPGFISIQGPELMAQKKLHAEKVGAKIIDDEIKSVAQLEGSNEYGFKSFSNTNDYYSDAIIIASGAQAKWLGLESEKEFQGYGVSACATCDGAFFRNKVVAVVGGGNTAVEEAIFLTRFAKEVILIHRRDKLRAEKVMQDRLFKNDKIKVMWNHTVEQILGEENPKKVTGIIVKSTEAQELEVDGVFIAIGHAPNTGIFKGFVEMDQQGYIITKPGTTLTSRAGVFAAGDVQDKVYRQAVVAAGTGCMAALDAEKFLESSEIKKEVLTTKSGFERSLGKHDWSYLERVEIEVISSNLEVIRESLKKLEKEIIAFAKQPPGFNNLISIKGIGAISAAIFVATIGDINDFSNPEKLTAYFGVVLRVSQSNQQCTIGRITKRGSKIGRTSLVQCTWIAIRYSPYLKSFYEHVKKKRGSAKAIIATARKFLTTIFYTLKNNWVFKDFTKFEFFTGQQS